jgi:hypothetical protein
MPRETPQCTEQTSRFEATEMVVHDSSLQWTKNCSKISLTSKPRFQQHVCVLSLAAFSALEEAYGEDANPKRHWMEKMTNKKTN